MNTRLIAPGRQFPPWFDIRDPEAQRGNARIRAIDSQFVVGRDRRDGTLQIWGPSLEAGGWVPIMYAMDDHGNYFLANVPWDLIAAAIVRGRNSVLNAAEQVYIHNERLRASEENSEREERQEKLKYAHRGIFGGRHNADDVLAGLRSRWV